MTAEVCPTCNQHFPTFVARVESFGIRCDDPWHVEHPHAITEIERAVAPEHARVVAERLHRFVRENDAQLVLSHHQGEWTTGMTWGEEGGDPELAGAATYAVGRDLTECFLRMLKEALG